MMGAGAASLAWAAATTEEAAVLRHRTLIGAPFLKAMLSLQATCGLRTAKLWRTLSKVNRHILPRGPSQPSRVVREAKKVAGGCGLRACLPWDFRCQEVVHAFVLGVSFWEFEGVGMLACNSFRH